MRALTGSRFIGELGGVDATARRTGNPERPIARIINPFGLRGGTFPRTRHQSGSDLGGAPQDLGVVADERAKTLQCRLPECLGRLLHFLGRLDARILPRGFRV